MRFPVDWSSLAMRLFRDYKTSVCLYLAVTISTRKWEGMGRTPEGGLGWVLLFLPLVVSMCGINGIMKGEEQWD